jgi:hypothetical protein
MGRRSAAVITWSQTNILAGDKSALPQEIESSAYRFGTGSEMVILYPLQPDNQKVRDMFKLSHASPAFPYGTSNINI